jgi:cbb3-type cytochrome oxidase subunit 1
MFGRIRPIHVNLVLFGFVTPGLLGAAFYYFPRLLRTRIYSDKLGVATVLLWNLTLVAAVVSLAAGRTRPKTIPPILAVKSGAISSVAPSRP